MSVLSLPLHCHCPRTLVHSVSALTILPLRRLSFLSVSRADLYPAYQSTAPHTYGEASPCTVVTSGNALVTRMFQWVGFAYDPARSEARLYLQTPFGAVEVKTKCQTMPDPIQARNNYVAGNGGANNPAVQMTHVTWFDTFITYEHTETGTHRHEDNGRARRGPQTDES